MNAMTHNPQPATFSHARRERLRGWLHAEFKSYVWHELLAALFYLALAVLAHAFVYVLVTMVALQFTGRIGIELDKPQLIFLVPLLILLAMYPLYWWLYRAPTVEIGLASGPVRLRCQHMTPVILVETGDQTTNADFRIQVLLFPVWAVASALRHLGDAVRALRVDVRTVSHVLEYLVAQGRRVTLLDLDAELREPKLPAALRALELQPGVLFFTGEHLSIALNDELAEQIKKAAGAKEAG
jgi:hypothetical protein